jgi:hypothetical protein
MIFKKFQYYKQWLEQDNYKPFYLAFLRVAMSWWLLKEVWITWPNMDLFFAQRIFIEPEKTIIRLLVGNPALIRTHYFFFVIPYIAVLVLYIFGIGKRLTAGLVFLFVFLLHKINSTIINSGDVAAQTILFYLIFADSYQYFVYSKSKIKNIHLERLNYLLSNLAILSVMLYLCIVYFAVGLSKLFDPLWQSGEAAYYALLNERFKGTSYNELIVKNKWRAYLINYGTIVFELVFPILIWFKKLRPPLLIIGIIFHLCIYVFMMIYGFEIVFILMYGMFLPNELLLKYANKIKTFFGGNKYWIIRFIGLPDTVQIAQ